MKFNKETIPILLNSVAALLAYGGWAVFANYEHGMQAWLTAGIVQGCYAFAATYSITSVAQWIYIKAGRGKTGIAAGFGASFLVMLSLPLTIHTLVHTPDIWETILPGLVWGSIYLIGYLYLKEIQEKKKAVP